MLHAGGTASANVLSQEKGQHIPETVRWPVWLEQSEWVTKW